MISHLLQSLPHDNYYKVILCERDLDEVLSSQNVMLKRRAEANPIDDSEAARTTSAISPTSGSS